MHHRRLTPNTVCVLAAFSLLVGACAGHTAPPSRSGARPSRATPARAATTATAVAATSSIIPANARVLPNRLLINARLDQTLSTARPEGFAFSTQVADAISAKDGTVAIPAGTVIRGVVVGVRPASGTKPALICVNLDFLELNGRDYGIRSSVKSVLVNDKPATILSRDSIATLFPNEPAVALHGTIVDAHGRHTATEPAVLPAGATFVIELDSAIAVQR